MSLEGAREIIAGAKKDRKTMATGSTRRYDDRDALAKQKLHAIEFMQKATPSSSSMLSRFLVLTQV